jgi:hypothetical protein
MMRPDEAKKRLDAEIKAATERYQNRIAAWEARPVKEEPEWSPMKPDPRWKQALAMRARGLSYKAIGDAFGVSAQTAKGLHVKAERYEAAPETSRSLSVRAMNGILIALGEKPPPWGSRYQTSIAPEMVANLTAKGLL